jgi:peroxiredoxin Q/BCP
MQGTMRQIPLFVVILLAAVGTLWCAEETEVAKKALAVGDEAPPFTLPGSDGGTHSLSDHLGKRTVVIAWFPKAFTGG